MSKSAFSGNLWIRSKEFVTLLVKLWAEAIHLEEILNKSLVYWVFEKHCTSEAAPVEGGNGNDVAGTQAELEQALGQIHDTTHEFLAGLLPVAGDRDRGIAPESRYEGQALANVGLWVITHFYGE